MKIEIRIFVFLLSSYLIVGHAFDLHSGEVVHSLNFKQVLLNPSSQRIGDYDYGILLYQNYKAEGLPDDFLIKKLPDISFKGSDIKSIRIHKAITVPKGNFYNITIVLNKSAADNFYKYTKLNLNKRIAIEIDNEIIAIPTIVSPISDTMTLGGSDKNLSEIKAIFSKISNNISVEGND